jgi:hypothetical protein
MKINPLLSLFIVQNQSFKDYFRIMKMKNGCLIKYLKMKMLTKMIK